MANEQRCPITEGLQVDHIERGDDHRMTNLRLICEAHHNIKSSEEGNTARAQRVSAVHSKFRRSEGHPGSL
jgi:5-methylcytosine-specific restriction protein A